MRSCLRLVLMNGLDFGDEFIITGHQSRISSQLLKQKILLTNDLLSRNEQDISHELYIGTLVSGFWFKQNVATLSYFLCLSSSVKLCLGLKNSSLIGQGFFDFVKTIFVGKSFKIKGNFEGTTRSRPGQP